MNPFIETTLKTSLKLASGTWKLLSGTGVLLFALWVGFDAVGQTAATREPWLWPFAPNSPWNMPIGSGAKFAGDTDPATISLRATNLCGFAVNGAPPATYEATNCAPGINCLNFSIPVYLATTNDPIRKMQQRDPNNPPTRYFEYRIPDRAVASGPTYHQSDSDYFGTNSGADAHMMVVDPTQHYVDESYSTRKDLKSPGNWICWSHVRNDLYGSGVGAGGTRAYGGSALGGLIRVWELKAGLIRHPLAMAMWGSQIAPGPVWPATSTDDPSEYCG